MTQVLSSKVLSLNTGRRRTSGGIVLAIGLAFGLACDLAGAAPALARIDLLDLPARLSPRAAAALLLDVAEAGTRLVAVGERGVVVTSDDGGASWRQASVPVSVTLTAVSFPTAEQGWAVGHDGAILHSEDGGRSWRKQFDGADANTLLLAAAEARLAALEADPSASAEDRTDAEWAVDDARAAGEFGPSRPLLDVLFDSPTDGFAVGSYGQIFRTRDGGERWTFAGGGLTNPEGYHYNAITRFSPQVLVIAGEAGRLYRSTDNGQTWQTLETGQFGHVYGALPLTDTPEALLAYGFDGRVLRTTDLETWTAVPAPAGKSLIGGQVDGGKITLFDARGGSIVSTDGGRSFDRARAPEMRPLSAVVPVSDGDRLAEAGVGGVRLETAAVSAGDTSMDKR